MVTLRRAGRQDAEAAAGLLSEHLAARTTEEILALLDRGGLCLLACSGERLVGVGTADVLDDARDAFPVGQRHLAAELDLPAPVGVLRSAVVAADERRSGVGTLLTCERLRWLRSRAAMSVISQAWVYPDGSVPARGQLRACGLVALRTVPAFWAAQLRANGLTCRQCGPACGCSAQLYGRRL